MAGSYSQIYIQVIFAVQGSSNLLNENWRDEVFKYISGIIKGKGQKAIIINGVEDHVHCLIGIKPSVCISDLIRDIKNNSSKFINEKNWVKGKFHWQEGYGVFSYSRSQIEAVYKYIENQEIHHQKKSFQEEYIEFLEKFEIDYKEEYLFEWLDE